jgi:hypothetical protein
MHAHPVACALLVSFNEEAHEARAVQVSGELGHMKENIRHHDARVFAHQSQDGHHYGSGHRYF